MKRILVTGGAGFIGSHTVDLLLSRGYAVCVFDNLSTGKKSNLDLKNKSLELIEADILDTGKLSQAVSACDAILHLAALASVPQSIADPLGSLQVNVTGFLKLLQCIRLSQKNIRFVYASSAAVYGEDKKLPCSDDFPPSENALSPYALEKASDERYAKLFATLFSIQSLGLRYFNVYGERQDPNSPYSGVISKFISAYQANKTITIFGDGKQSRDFISVKDVARANVLALENNYAGILNIATGTPETLLDLLRYIEKTGNHATKYQFAGARTGDIRESYAAIENAKKYLGFEAEISLSEGIEAFIYS